jgi:type IV pilus assembly protein PilB
MVTRTKQRLGDILVDAGIITEDQLRQALDEQERRNERLGKVLVDLGFVDEETIVSHLSAHLGMPSINLSEIKEIEPRVRKLVPDFFVRRQLLIPIAREKNVLTVAMADPMNILALDDIALMTGCKVAPAIASESDVRAAIERFYGTEALDSIIEDMDAGDVEVVKETEEEEELDVSGLMVESSEAPIVNLVNHIMAEAIRAGASDIHIEPYENYLRVRYRIDGVLYEVVSPPKKVQNAIVSRIKVISRLDIAERRLPQDGRAKVRLENREVDLRISILPTSFGEKVVMRILDPSSLCLDLTKLGFEQSTLAQYQKGIKTPYGIILVTGPTGCGKSTTLYSSLKELNSPDKNILTIEDPVEYVLDGINQVQVKPEIGLDFASGLRAFVRQDPDIIMVGEIRDRETAEVAIQAALTGHLVFSTLHTNDAPGAVTRLVNMGVEPFLITSTVIMCVAQRLIRMICPKCKESYKVPRQTMEDFGIKVEEEGDVTLYRGRGCTNCTNIGYKGRTGIFEVMMMEPEVEELILAREPASVIREEARKHGMMTLREAAVKKVLDGVTTMEELLRVTFEERL